MADNGYEREQEQEEDQDFHGSHEHFAPREQSLIIRGIRVIRGLNIISDITDIRQHNERLRRYLHARRLVARD